MNWESPLEQHEPSKIGSSLRTLYLGVSIFMRFGGDNQEKIFSIYHFHCDQEGPLQHVLDILLFFKDGLSELQRYTHIPALQEATFTYCITGPRRSTVCVVCILTHS